MIRSAIVDAGPLVAAVDPGDAAHEWAAEAFSRIRPPMLTCEAIIAEVMYLLRASEKAQDSVMEWLERGCLFVAFDLGGEAHAVRRLMAKYRDVPMSLADACVVRMSEVFDDHAVCTVNRDFRIWRKHGKAAIPLIIPDDR